MFCLETIVFFFKLANFQSYLLYHNSLSPPFASDTVANYMHTGFPLHVGDKQWRINFSPQMAAILKLSPRKSNVSIWFK